MHTAVLDVCLCKASISAVDEETFSQKLSIIEINQATYGGSIIIYKRQTVSLLALLQIKRKQIPDGYLGNC